MITVHAQCGLRSAGNRGGRWIGRICALRLVATRGGVERRVLDVVAHAADVVLAHRLDVEQRAAVVEMELAVPAVVHGVAEVHELRRGADVELQALEDGDDVDALVLQRLLHALGVDRAGAHPLLDGDLQHLLAAEIADDPGHSGPVDQLPDQQQFGYQRRELVVRQCGVPTCHGGSLPDVHLHGVVDIALLVLALRPSPRPSCAWRPSLTTPSSFEPSGKPT